ncbi:potential protein lysine methyltransferase [Mucor ambiguus]|uniref:Potential protein lysine methyltransferase n=1 Tax=Mucor ambiguus TaxID=91626 RepID=A0A0C9MGC1_9FUNG|nr:potential protein lysine methyltransferase [Mucor ambiguus]
MNLIEIAVLPGKGRGYRATTTIAAGTVLHVSGPLATTVSQEWILETCMWCFNFSYPKKQKIKVMTMQEEKALIIQWKVSPKKNNSSLFKDMLFCSESCKSQFKLHDKTSLIVASHYRLDQQHKSSSNHTTDVPIPAHVQQSIESIPWISIDNNELLTLWLEDAWDCITKSDDICRDIDDNDKAMCRLIAACISRKHNYPDHFEELLVIQNNELAHFRNHYTASTSYSSRINQLPILKDGVNKRETLLSMLPAEVVGVMALYIFFARTLTNPLNQVPALANVDHQLFRSIYFRERANSFGLWELGDSGVSLADGGVTDDLELLGWGIYPSAVYFNHSCDANVVKVREGRQMKFIARRTIEKDEEACISYGSVGEDVNDRRARLLSHYHFLCQCTRCIQEGSQHNTIIR